MKINIDAQLKFTVEIPALQDLKPADIPAPYTAQEWHDQLLTEAVEAKCGMVPEWFTFAPEAEEQNALPTGSASSKRYAVHPGYVTSRNDGQDHYLGFMRLCQLYRVAPAECVDMSQEKNWRGMDVSNLVRLTPRYDGNYALPNSQVSR
jgi:hypothetical protein